MEVILANYMKTGEDALTIQLSTHLSCTKTIAYAEACINLSIKFNIRITGYSAPGFVCIMGYSNWVNFNRYSYTRLVEKCYRLASSH